MNANELADKLQELDSKLHLIELFKSATMLRQQQAEIEALNELNTMLKDAIEKRIEMDANELADIQAFKTEELTMWERNTTATMLRQQQAEIEALKGGFFDWSGFKKLTDEEILFIADEVDIPDAPDTKDLIEFARAILRKAQEK